MAMFNSYVKLPEGMFGFYHGFLPSNIKGCSVSIFPTETKFQDLPSAENPQNQTKQMVNVGSSAIVGKMI